MDHKIFKIDNEKFGLSMENHVIKFFAPDLLLFDIENLSKFEEISLLKNYIKILADYARSKDEQISHGLEIRKATQLDIIEAYINIVNDYIQNGDFRIFVKLNNKSSNRIDWSRTLKNNDVIIQKKKFIYRNFQSSNKQINPDDAFFKIYADILNDATTMFLNGPIYDNGTKVNDNEAIYYINKYIDTHFRDRELFIAHQLKKIYSNMMISNINDKIFEVKYHKDFEHIFQFLVEENLKDYSYLKYKKNGYYTEIHSNKKTYGMSLRFDHFIKIDKRNFIIDSKFYKKIDFENSPNGLPKTCDIIKQIGYKLYVSEINNLDAASIDNIFIFPRLSDGVDLDYFAIHNVDNDIKNYFTIKCIKLDTKNLIDNYLNNKMHIGLINLLRKI